MLRGQRLIHVPVELWVGDGQTQRTWEYTYDRSAPLGVRSLTLHGEKLFSPLTFSALDSP